MIIQTREGSFLSRVLFCFRSFVFIKIIRMNKGNNKWWETGSSVSNLWVPRSVSQHFRSTCAPTPSSFWTIITLLKPTPPPLPPPIYLLPIRQIILPSPSSNQNVGAIWPEFLNFLPSHSQMSPSHLFRYLPSKGQVEKQPLVQVQILQLSPKPATIFFPLLKISKEWSAFLVFSPLPISRLAAILLLPPPL